MEQLSAVIRKAHKEHKCNFCGTKISIGEQYENQTNVYDGELYYWKTHLSCKSLTRELNMYDDIDDEGLTADAFRECVWEYLRKNNLDEDDLNWFDAITKVKELLLKEQYK